jgi:DNA-directed RNA polymerase specialized sigma24 family protein
VKTEVEEQGIKTGLLGTEQEREDAIRDAYELYKRPLFVFIKETVAPTLDYDEIASAINDVFRGLASYVTRGKFTSAGSLKSLLFTMARRKGYDQLRRKTKKSRVLEAESSSEGEIGVLNEDEFTTHVAQILSEVPEISVVWKNAADDASTNEIMRQFRLWLATARLPRLQRKVAQAILTLFDKYSGDIPDQEIGDEIAAASERPTVASVRSARNELIRKFATIIQSQERTKP